MRLCFQFSILLVVAVLLGGCGGSGSSGPNWYPHPPPNPGVNQAPSITSVAPASPAEIESGEQRTIVVAATDPDGDPLTYTWQLAGGGTLQNASPPHSAVFTAPTTTTPTSSVVTVTVSDNHSHSATASVIFNVNGAVLPQNDPPVINSVSANPESVAEGETTTLTVDADDADGDPLTYVWLCDCGTIEAQSDSTATWRAPVNAGEYGINVSVSDGKNPAVLGHVTVKVGSGGGSPVVNGLAAEYIRNSRDLFHPDLSQGQVVARRIDPAINFDWGHKAPVPELITEPATGNASDFGVRWRGHVLCDTPGTYFFRARFDDGIRVWIWNDDNRRVLVIDGWQGGPNVITGSISLAGSRWYPITVEHFEDEGVAYVQLMWTPPGGTDQVVPSNKLRAD